MLSLTGAYQEQGIWLIAVLELWHGPWPIFKLCLKRDWRSCDAHCGRNRFPHLLQSILWMSRHMFHAHCYFCQESADGIFHLGYPGCFFSRWAVNKPAIWEGAFIYQNSHTSLVSNGLVIDWKKEKGPKGERQKKWTRDCGTLNSLDCYSCSLWSERPLLHIVARCMHCICRYMGSTVCSFILHTAVCGIVSPYCFYANSPWLGYETRKVPTRLRQKQN